MSELNVAVYEHVHVAAESSRCKIRVRMQNTHTFVSQ